MVMDSNVSLSLRSAAPSTADRLLKAHLQAEYVKELWFFLAAIIAVLTAVNFATRLIEYFSKPNRVTTDDQSPEEKRSPEAFAQGRTGKVSLRRLPAAFASAFRIVAFRLTVPIGPSSVASVTELLFIVGYIVALLVWLWVNTHDMETFMFEDRAAHLASCQLPLIVALAGKNNIIAFLTGISHEKLNVLHRAGARSCLLLLWIHAMVRIAGGLPAKFDLSNGWMRSGVLSLAAFTLATIMSVRPIRQAAFEFFLVSHIILIGVFLIGGFFHARDPGFGTYIWPALLVWGLDRFLRLSRLLWNNRVWKGIRANSSARATVELLSHDTVRLTLQRKLHWQAGQHAYVILPSVSNLPTEAHPFTISSIPHSLDGTEGPSEKDLVFIIRGRSGFTRRLRDHAMQKAVSPVSAYVDGPYGNPPNLKVFSTCILVAGGSGVSYTLPLLMDLVYSARAGSCAVRRIIFIWVIRDVEHLSWIAKLLTSAVLSAPSNLAIEPRIHITGTKGQLPDIKTLDYDSVNPSSSTSLSDEEKKAEMLAFTAFKTKKGRPDLKRLLRNAVTSAAGPVSVDVAGPSALAQSVRSALSSDITSPLAVLKGRQPVTLHVETFGMVKG